MLLNFLPLTIVLLFNFWIWQIFSFNFFNGLLVFTASTLLYFVTQKPNRNLFILLITCYVILLFSQYKDSSINSLTFLNEREQVLQIQRMHGYPPRFARWANWLEARPEILTFYKVQENFFEAASPNLYFFANHPRERAGIVETEKFPYIFFPFFVIGIFGMERKKLKYLFLSLSPLLLISIIGSSHPLGPFTMFPLLGSNIATGINQFIQYKKPKKLATKHFLLAIIFLLVFIQTYSYATF